MKQWLQKFFQTQPQKSPEPGGLPKADCVKALAAEPGVPVFEAVLTTIRSHERLWEMDARGVISDHAALAGHIMAARALAELRESLLLLREQGRKED